jgi:uncharacterized protein (DUF1778 family)
MEKRKRGRPPKDPEALRGEVYQLRLTDAEREAYSGAAEAAGQKLSEWMRAVLTRAAKRQKP